MKKLWIKLLCCSVFAFTCLSFSAFAASEPVNEFLFPNPLAKVVLTATDTNVDTGVVTNLAAQDVSIKSIAVELDNSVTIVGEFGFDLPPPTVSPLASDSHTSDGDIKTTLTLNYDLDTYNNKIRINSGSVRWQPKSSIYGIKDREFYIMDGQAFPFQKGISKYPTTNYLSVTTGWGYVEKYPHVTEAATGPRATAFCKGYVIGMESAGTHEYQCILRIE